MLFVRKLGYPSVITIHKQDNKVSEEVNEKAEERLSFFLLTVVLAPVLAVAIVGGYGFAVWISQMIFGPPG